MSGDPRLDALLRDLPPPPVPAALRARVLAAAGAVRQETRPAYARRNARDRRGKWLRRPVLAGTAALGLVFTSAVAATLAGVPIPQKIAAVFFPETRAPEPRKATVPHRAPGTEAAPARAETAAVKRAAEPPAWSGPDPWRRLFMVERIISARRAMGLPTPGADRLERQLRNRAERWQAATPEQRAAWIRRQQLRQDVSGAMLSTPEGREELARQDRAQGWRLRRPAGMPLTPAEWEERQRLIRNWPARRAAGIPLSPEERELRFERRQWREAQRAQWQVRPERNGPAMPPGTQAPPEPDRPE